MKLVVVIDGDRFEAQDEDSSCGAARIKQALEEWAEHVKSIREAARPVEQEDNDAD